jgi:glycopeptide antibiotics resistance protein
VLKGSETHENGNSKKRWVFEYLHMHTLAILFVVYLVVGFICLLFKFHGISETFQNLGFERVGHSSLFVKVLCGALLHNYVGGFVVIIKVERLSHMYVFWNHKQGL